MKVRQIAGVLLVVYVAISMSFAFHIHLTDRPGEHCSICQALDAPGIPQSLSTPDPLFSVEEFCRPVVHFAAHSDWAFVESERAPPQA
jgi:hypothetical protein